MSRVHSRDTGPEMLLRKRLFAKGFRYRVDYRHQGGKIDIAFPRHKLALLVDGCFWHCCPMHGSRPKNNKEFWDAKFKLNLNRDKRQTDALHADGWTVLRFWEHELRENMEEVMNRITIALDHRR